MNSIYQSNIQPLQGCDIKFIVDRGLHPRLFRLCHFAALFILKSNASVVISDCRFLSINIFESEIDIPQSSIYFMFFHLYFLHLVSLFLIISVTI